MTTEAAGVPGHRSVSLRAKILLIVLVTTGAALLVACGAFLVYDHYSFRKHMRLRFEILADIVSDQSVAGVAFGDAKALQENLATLRSESQIVQAAVYDAAGRLLAGYRRPGYPSAPPPAAPEIESRFEAYSLFLTRPIVQEHRPIGRFFLHGDLEELRLHLRRGIGSVLLVLGAASVAALLLSLKLSAGALRPIFRLANAVKKVSTEKDYAIQVPSSNGDELGLLIRGFNEMLRVIRERDEALLQAREGLEKRVDERTQEIRGLNESLQRHAAELESANQELEAFAYSVSHDLKAPLRSIAGFSAVLAEDYREKLDDSARTYLGRIIDSSQRMAKLIDALLALARLARPEVRRQTLDLTALARTVAEEWRTREPGRNVRVEIAEGMKVDADPQLLRAVLENLFGNAWKFTRVRAEGRIEVGTLLCEGRRAFFVRDNGAGFDMAHASKLFGLFQRLHRMDEFEGMGIGLATVQRIVRRHGGQVWAEGQVDRGATFYFTLG